MVGAGQPEGGAAARAREPRHYVLQRGKHGVTHVQLPRHIWRRHAHHKGLPCRIRVRLKVPRPLPPAAPTQMPAADAPIVIGMECGQTNECVTKQYGELFGRGLFGAAIPFSAKYSGERALFAQAKNLTCE
jgi:hypothetical protein